MISLLAATGIDKARILLAIAIILLVARLAGALFRRLGQPVVVGEMLAGVLLGPTLLGKGISEALFPLEIRSYLMVIAEIGLVMFMFVVGVELDTRLIKGRERAAAIIATTSVALPFALGTVVAVGLYQQHSIVAGRVVPELTFVLFFGAAMSATAFPVLARILSDRGMFRTPLGSMTLATAAVADIIAWTVLALVTALAAGGGTGTASLTGEPLRKAGTTVSLSVGFCLGLFLIVRPLLRRLISLRQRYETFPATILSVVLIGILLSAATTEYIGIHSIFGAFLFGVIMPKQQDEALIDEILVRVEHVSISLFLPVFFVVAGLGVNLRGMRADEFGTLAVILLVACVGKFVGTAIPARALGFRRRRSAALGVLMNTRGLTELVILVVGRDAGVLDDRLFGMLVVMAIVTTLMTSPILTWVYPKRILRMDQAAAENLSNLRGFHVLAASDSARLLIRLGRIGGELCGSERPASVSLCSLVPVNQSEIGTGITTQYLELVDRAPAIERLEADLAAKGINTAYSPLSSALPLSELGQQAETSEPDVVLIDGAYRDWFDELARTTDHPLVLVSGPPPTRRPANSDEPAQTVRVELSGDTPLAVELGCRVALATGLDLELVDSTGSQRRRVSSYRSRVDAAGIRTVDPGAAEPAAIVRDVGGALSTVEQRPLTVFTVRGQRDDQGDMFDLWLDRQRAPIGPPDGQSQPQAPQPQAPQPQAPQAQP
jgi:Kef-type K+ transport system membrane component KefB